MVTRRRGFTLIELLVVLSIIALLLTLALPRYFSSVDKSKEAVLKENLNQMRDAISRYYGDRESIRSRSTLSSRSAICARCRSIRSPRAPRPGRSCSPRIRRRAASPT